MEKISNYQLFALALLYQLGTTIIFGFSSNAGRDAWISVLISTFIGIIIISIHIKLMRMQPGLTLMEWYQTQFGGMLGTPIAWMYIILIVYDGGRLVGDLRDLIPTTILPKTPDWVFLGIFLSVVSYAVYSGIESIARVGEILLPVIFIFFIMEIILIFSSDIIHVEYLHPIVGKGWKKILNTVWPLGITQTFAKTIRFAMIWPLVNKSEKIIKSTLLATILTGFFLAFLDCMAIIVLGEGTFSRSIYPLYTLIQQIDFAEFIENLDALGVLYFLATSFIKISIIMYGIVYGIQKLTYSKNRRVFILPVALIILYLGMTMASNVSDHVQAGLEILPYNLWIPLYLVLPIILFVVTLISKKYGLKKIGKNN